MQNTKSLSGTVFDILTVLGESICLLNPDKDRKQDESICDIGSPRRKSSNCRITKREA